MSNFKMVRNVKVMPGSKAHDLLESKDVLDHKRAKRLVEFCDKASRIDYRSHELALLRNEYKDVT